MRIDLGVSRGYTNVHGHLIANWPRGEGPLWEFIREFIKQHEGARSDHPRDKGGLTVWGISSRFWPGVFRQVDGSSDSLDTACRWYWARYAVGGGLIRLNEISLAQFLFNMMINLSRASAVKMLQRVVNKLNARHGYRRLNVDGILGPNTARAVNRLSMYSVLPRLADLQEEYYRSRPRDQQEAFLKGWLNRIALTEARVLSGASLV